MEFRMMRRWWCVVPTLTLVMSGSVGASPAWAQDDEPELGWSNAAELTVVFHRRQRRVEHVWFQERTGQGLG